MLCKYQQQAFPYQALVEENGKRDKDQQLDTSVQVFINGTTRSDKTRQVLKLSEIFFCYRVVSVKETKT